MPHRTSAESREATNPAAGELGFHDYTSVLSEGDYGISESTRRKVLGFDRADRLFNFGLILSEQDENLDVGCARRAVRTLVTTDWSQAPEDDRALAIDFAGALLDRLGLESLIPEKLDQAKTELPDVRESDPEQLREAEHVFD